MGRSNAAICAGDDALYHLALDEIDAALDQAAADGFIGPESMRHQDRWAHAVFFRAVLAQYEISGDRRYLNALARHYRSTPHPMSWDRDVTGVEALVYLYQQTGDLAFLEQAEDLYARFNTKFPEHDCSLQTLSSDKKSSEHGVTFNEIAKLAAILYGVTGKTEYRQAVLNGYAKLDRDQLLADGLHSCSEDLRGRNPLDSHETCDITDHTWALGYLLQITGDAKYADRIEKIIFNALPGAVTRDFKALQYFSCPNQVLATHTSNHNRLMRGFNWMSYRPDHEVQCCPGNVHRAMPNYVARQWLKGGDSELIAALYGPGSIRTHLGGAAVTVTERSAYPAEQAVEFDIQPDRPARLHLHRAHPGLVSACRPFAQRKAARPGAHPGDLCAGRAPVAAGRLPAPDLPFELALQRFPKGGVSLDYGPLTFSLPIAAHAEIEAGNSTNDQRRIIHEQLYTPRTRGATADFPAWELTPASRWNYALCLDETSLARLVQVAWHSPAVMPFDPEHPFVTLRVPARQVAGWELDQRQDVRQENNWVVDGKWRHGLRTVKGSFTFTPQLPGVKSLKDRLGEEVEWIELAPYGATQLRLTVFPQAPVVYK